MAAAAAGQPIPETLTPPVSGLRRDSWRVVTPSECYATGSESRTDVCTYGPDGAPHSMVIFGDSRAGMWLPALRDIAEAAGWTMYYFVKTACPVAEVPWSQTADCADWREWALAQITRLKPDLAILSTREEDGTLENGSWEPGLLATIQALAPASDRVVVFSETPELGYDPVTCLNRWNATLADCTFPLTRLQKDINAADRRAAAAGGAEFLDLTPWLCWADKCPLVINATVVSYGEGHLTRSYAGALVDHLRAALALD